MADDLLNDGFHPDKNLPACMMPDGGECCRGHAAVVEDWHKQRGEIEELRAALVGRIAQLDERTKLGRIAKLDERTNPTVADKEVDREIEAMTTVYYSLDNLSAAARERVLLHVLGMTKARGT